MVKTGMAEKINQNYYGISQTMRVAAVAVACAILFSPAFAEEQRPAAENFVENPGFENDSPQIEWFMNNWWKGRNGETNEVALVRDRENPHSGNFSQKFEVKKFRGGDVLIQYPSHMFKPGMSVEVSFWARGEDNSTVPIDVLLRKCGSPYTKYFFARLSLSSQWRRYVFRTTLSPQTDPDTRLMFIMAGAGVLWLDDVSVKSVPKKDTAAPLVGNRVANGSFEVGVDKWYAQFRETGGYHNSPASYENNINAKWESIEMKDAPHGRRVLHFQVFPKCRIEINSSYFPLRYGHEYTVSFWLKASAADKTVTAGLLGGKFPNMVIQSKVFTATTSWKRFELQVTPKLAYGGVYTLSLGTTKPGKYWLDGVCVNEGDKPLEDTTTEDFGWQRSDENHVANIFGKNNAVEFDVLAKCKPGEKKVTLAGKVLDAWNREVGKLWVEIALDNDGYGEKKISLPSARYGAFKAELYRKDVEHEQTMPVTEIMYTVIPELPSPKDVKDSFFGGHVQLTPYNLAIAEKGGFRWLRLHPPLNTKWAIIQPTGKEYTFYLDGIRGAYKKGFKLLGSFQTVPKRFADVPKGESHSIWASYPPADWKAWQEYVSITAKVFYPYIKDWEIWNEADGGFLKVPPGKEKDKIYLEMCRQTVAGVKKTGLDLCLVGGVITGCERTFMLDILEGGVGKYVDAMSFHWYSSPPPSAIGEKMLSRIARWQRFRNRSNQPMPIWQTEGNPNVVDDQESWLRTLRQPGSEDGKPARAPVTHAADMIRTMAACKVVGVKRYFHYSAFARPSGSIIYRTWFMAVSMIDLNGIPSASYAAHAACVRFLEGATPENLHETKVVHSKITQAVFDKEGKKVIVVWSDSPIAFRQVVDLQQYKEYRVFDVMGNPMELTQDMMLSSDPVYLSE